MDAIRSTQQHNAMPSYPAQDYGAPSAPVLTLSRNGGSATYSNAMAYPSLRDFMGMELTEEMIRLNMPEYGAVAVSQPNSSKQLFSEIFLSQINCNQKM